MLKKKISIIIADILNLAAYTVELPKLKVCRTCPTCGIANALHLHGSYPRKSDRFSNDSQSFNLVKIIRFLCKFCHTTCSALPECIPPRRWYMWITQQLVIQAYMAENSWKSMQESLGVSIKTCKRWCIWLKDKFYEHAHVLKNVAGNLHQILDGCVNFKSFWQQCFAHISLDRAMLLCNQAGFATP